jgi:hypothetical protein
VVVRDVDANQAEEGGAFQREGNVDDADGAAESSGYPDLFAAVGPAGCDQDTHAATGAAGGFAGVRKRRVECAGRPGLRAPRWVVDVEAEGFIEHGVGVVLWVELRFRKDRGVHNR